MAIVDRHLAPGCPEPVNVDAVARQVAKDGLADAGPDIFAPAQRHIYNLMKFDSYSRFVACIQLHLSQLALVATICIIVRMSPTSIRKYTCTFRFLKSGIYKEALLCEMSGVGVAKDKGDVAAAAADASLSNSAAAAAALSSLNKHSLGRKSKVVWQFETRFKLIRFLRAPESVILAVGRHGLLQVEKFGTFLNLV